MTLAVPLAFAAAVAAVLGAWEWLAVLERSRVAAALARIVEPVARAGRDGREPSASERRRLAVLAAAALMAAGWLAGGTGLALLAALCGPTAALGAGPRAAKALRRRAPPGGARRRARAGGRPRRRPLDPRRDRRGRRPRRRRP